MFKAALVTGLTLCAATANARTIPAPDLVNGWQHDSNQLSESTTVSFTVYAKEQRLDKLKQIAAKVSDPTHEAYGNYLSTTQINELTRPKASDIATIKQWLGTATDATVMATNDRTFQVHLPASSAADFLETTFRPVVNHGTKQASVLASDYQVPDDVHAVANVMGLHGLPLPPRVSGLNDDVQGPSPPAKPANVTPAVITSTYGISGVTPQASSGNKQAVAEFQGQTMASSDLSAFFKAYVPNAAPGDDTVSKFVGDPGDKTGQTEASLDIQYIMGVAPGIATEFWLWNANDFCADLKNWTTTLLAAESPPLVTSVSYGWQGNLTGIGCHPADADAVDADFVKLAAKGITIIFASGDSGSGYAPANQCSSAFQTDTELTGTVQQTFPVEGGPQQCCYLARSGAGWTYDGPDTPPPSPSEKCPAGTNNTVYTGDVLQKINTIKNVCCLIANDQSAGYSFMPKGTNSREGACTLFKTITGTKSLPGSYSGKAVPRVKANCTVFSKVTGKKTSTGKTSSSPGGKTPVVLWPSWPASSPWVTAVGATRFVGQKVGNEEMATDQFGSGGGFSGQFGQSPNAKWQSADVANYLKVVPQELPLPPAGSFPAQGRATPDVCALGEGFQVVQGKRVMAVAGTSASAPTFAAVVSLLNEHRLQNGKKQLGFLNPFLYQNIAAFTDVTKGTNAIGRGTGPIKYGFDATKGWDPATGMGSPNFSKLIAAIDALP